MPRKIPQRTCLGCQVVHPKRDMIRIVRTPQGLLEIDPTGKKSGRGAYVCPSMECLALLQKSKRIERTLGLTPPPLFFEQLQERIGDLNPESRR